MICLTPVGSCGSEAESWQSVEAGFVQSPAAARPQTLWFWMNGNVSLDGITRDLTAMKRAGLSGAVLFDGGTYQPAGSMGYLQKNWREAFAHAVQEASRLGLGFSMHNGPGWSSSGGPWITPELSMKQLVWTETRVAGPQRLDVNLRQPQTNLGFYRDAIVVAFPSLPGEETPYGEQIGRLATTSGRVLEKAVIADGDLATKLRLEPAEGLLIEFAQPIEVHGVTASAGTGARLGRLLVEASYDGSSFQQVCTITEPSGLGIRASGVRDFPPVQARIFRVSAATATELAEFILHRNPQVVDWPYKANFAFRLGSQVRPARASTTKGAIDPKTVLNLTSQLDANGRLKWEVPAGAWTVLRLGYTTTGMQNTAASAAGTGLECDKLGREGVEAHFQHVQARLLEDVGALAGKSFVAVTIDSYEAGMQNWTASFPGEFRRRMGYDIVPYLPAMTGRVVGDAAISDRFLFDVRTVQAEMVAENYYGRMRELCNERGLKLYIEGYGSSMFDELRVSGIADYPMAEFWTRTPWTPNRNVKMVASAAHTYGKPVLAAEAFTGEEFTSRWLDYPYALKAVGDDMFALGVNQFIFHRFAHQPHPDAFPGMAMGPWGFHFDRTNTWFEQSSGWIDYLARSQHLLRQGNYAADVLYFVGERPPNLAQMAMPVLPAGYNFDHVDAEVLLKRAQVKDGAIELANGARYRLLMLPPDLRGVTLELMTKLAELVRDGAVIVGPKPEFCSSLRGFPASDHEVQRLGSELWIQGQTGKGRVFADCPVGDALRELGIAPDFDFRGELPDASLSWTHRILPDGDVYFVSNRQRRVEKVVCDFRVSGRQPEIWNPETGGMRDAVVFEVAEGRTRMALHLEPAQSAFVVFRRPLAFAGESWIAKDGKRVLDAALPPTQADAPVHTSFTMSVWAKPDTELRVMPSESIAGRIDEIGKNYLISADEGDRRFGEGHATAGLAVGRNGAFVVERSSAAAPAVLVAPTPIAGWTHFAVTYRDGRPSLYVNGKRVRTGLMSGSLVHPGIGAPPPRPDTVLHFAALDALAEASGIAPPPSQGRAFYFEGNFTSPELYAQPLSDSEIAALVERGLPPPPAPDGIDAVVSAEGKTRALVWESGLYSTANGGRADAIVQEPIMVGSPWSVAFQKNRGAPASIQLSKLRSLHEHSDPGVRFFSGTATYTQTVEIPADWLRAGRRVVLDLGRVEVVSEVRVNGSDVGLLWKEPYRLDITDAVKAGQNALEIRVTNLLANRLIGDEQLPPENDYGVGPERGIVRFPDWYVNGKPKPAGGRFTFTTWKFFRKDEPLLASGLLGPVRLFNPVQVEFSKP